MSISTNHIFIAGLVSYPGAFIFGAMTFPFIVVPTHALCMTVICMPWEHTLLALRFQDRWKMAPLLLTIFGGWLIKLGIPYLVGRGIHSLIS